MTITGKGIAFFIVFFVTLIPSYSVQSSSYTSSTQNMTWLSLLSANMQRLQPDKACPQNQINDLQVSKTGGVINSHIREVAWDLDCVDRQTSKVTSSTPQLDTVTLQNKLLNQLSALPDFTLQLDKLNLLSKLLKSKFSATLAVENNAEKLSAVVSSELFNGQLTLYLKTQSVTLNAIVNVSTLPYYIQFSDKQREYLNGELTINYQSAPRQWHQGEFSLAWKGQVPHMTELATLSMVGHIDLLSHQLSVANLAINMQQVVLSISEKQAWKVGYIKLKNSAPIDVNYATLQTQSLPVDLRIGTSHIFTSVERGKSKRIRIDKQKLPPLSVQLTAQNNEHALQVDWILSTLSQRLNGSFQLNEETATLQVSKNIISLKELINSSHNYLDALASLEVETGKVSVDLSAQYNRNDASLIFKSSLISDEVSGKNESILFDGVKLHSHLHYFIDASHQVTIIEDKQRVDINNLFVGIPIQALTVNAQLNAGEPVVQHFKARLLGGRVDLDDFKLVAPSQTILNFSGVSLANVIKYTAYPEIESKAILDAMLPLKLTADGVEISDGIIFARFPGGYIKVPENTVIKTMGRGNPAFSFTMQLLSNFQFDTLQGRIDYTDDGESDLQIEIKGVSPTVSGTQPVHFNYSHKENILKLLKSLRFNEQLVRDIKERY